MRTNDSQFVNVVGVENPLRLITHTMHFLNAFINTILMVRQSRLCAFVVIAIKLFFGMAMRTLFEKYLQENSITYTYVRCPLCQWMIYLINPKDHEFESIRGRSLGFNYSGGDWSGGFHYWYDDVVNCPKCNKIWVR